MGQGLVGIGQDASGPGPELCTTLARAQHQDLVDAFLGSYWGVSLPSAWEFEVDAETGNLRVFVLYAFEGFSCVVFISYPERHQYIVNTEPSIFSTADGGSAAIELKDC
jgi:hypothetical protein